jgi:DNA helicase HerA-like ATPase
MNIAGVTVNQNLASTPIVMVENNGGNGIAAFWGATIPAIPDLIAVERDRSGMTYESALQSLIQAQESWIKKLHGESKSSLSLRVISSGKTNEDLVLGIVGKTEGKIESETVGAASNFFNKIRDTIPNGYLIAHCQTVEDLTYLRLPFLPSHNGELGEFRRQINSLQTISHQEIPDITGVEINSWQSDISNFQDLYRALVSHPTPVAVAFNVRPTQLTVEESKYMGQIADAYARIASISVSEGESNRIMNTNVSVQEKRQEAEQAAKTWQQFQQSLSRSPFELTIDIMSESAIPQSIIGALQSAVGGKPNRESQVPGSGSMIVAKSEVQKMAVRQNWADLTLHRWANSYDLGRVPWLYSPEELHSVFRLPIADRSGVWGLPSAPGASDARRLVSISATTAEINIGNLKLSKKQLTQHLLICGVPGSGKTNTSLYLLEKLWESYRIPWLVLEPAKTEYRGLSAVPTLQDDLLIFSLGDERVAPFRFNPFELPTGINLDSHQGALIDLFSVSMSMWGPLPNVVEQLIQEAYKRKGFTTMGDNSNLLPPCFSDVANLVPEIVPRLGYKKETTDEISAAISVRLNRFRRGGLGRMLDTTRSIPFDDLMQKPVILEMSQITNSDDRAFMMGLILNRCYQYWTARRHEATGELKHLLLVEEAHNLLGKVAESGDQESANPKGKAVKNFANMLAEVRGFGQGIAIAEQNPEGLVADVMVNTNIKLAHRTVEAKNRESLGRSMLLTPQQEKSLASLGVGQMLYYVGGSPEPMATAAPNFKDDASNKFNPRLRDDEISQQFQEFKNQHAKLYAPSIGCPTDPNLAFCIERGADLIQILSQQPKYKEWKLPLMLKLLAVPFGYPVQSIRGALGSILVENGANHLKPQEIEGLIDSAISFLAMEAAQEKGKIHGWLGQQTEYAQYLLVDATKGANGENLTKWINVCKIPQHILQMGLPHAEYLNLEAPGVFRYENMMAIDCYQGEFRKDMGKQINPAIALQNWAARAIVFPWLSSELQRSLLTCLAIQLTRDYPDDLLIFLGKP